MKKYLLLFLLLPAICFAGFGYIVPDAGQTVASGGDCTTVIESHTGVETTTADIKDGASHTIVGYIYNEGTEKDICKIVFYMYAKDGAACEANTYHVEIWSINANGVGGCANEDGCLNAQIGSDSSGVAGVSTWSNTAVSYTFSSSVTLSANTDYVIGITHNNAANAATEASLWLENLVGGDRAYCSGDTSGATLQTDSGAPYHASYE